MNVWLGAGPSGAASGNRTVVLANAAEALANVGASEVDGRGVGGKPRSPSRGGAPNVFLAEKNVLRRRTLSL